MIAGLPLTERQLCEHPLACELGLAKRFYLAQDAISVVVAAGLGEDSEIVEGYTGLPDLKKRLADLLYNDLVESACRQGNPYGLTKVDVGLLLELAGAGGMALGAALMGEIHSWLSGSAALPTAGDP